MTGQRHDLGASFYRLARAMLDAEQPVLREHGVEMWDYAVLAELEHGPARTQGQLAEAIGRDKTRLIPILDRLGDRRLVERTPDPADRRNRIVALTQDGRALLAACRADIRALEDRLLADLLPAERATFITTLERLLTAIPSR